MRQKLRDCFFALMKMQELSNELKSLDLAKDKHIDKILQTVDRVCANFMKLDSVGQGISGLDPDVGLVTPVEHPIRFIVESTLQEKYPVQKSLLDRLLEDISIEQIFRYRVSSLKTEYISYILYLFYHLSQRCLERLMCCSFNTEESDRILKTMQCDLGNLSMLCCTCLLNNDYFMRIYMIAGIAQFLVKQSDNLQLDPIVKALISDFDFEISRLIRKCLGLEFSKLSCLFKLLTKASSVGVSAGDYSKLFIPRLLLLAGFATELAYKDLTKIKEKFRNILVQWKVNHVFKYTILRDIEAVLCEAQKDVNFQKKRSIARILTRLEKYITSYTS